MRRAGSFVPSPCLLPTILNLSTTTLGSTSPPLPIRRTSLTQPGTQLSQPRRQYRRPNFSLGEAYMHSVGECVQSGSAFDRLLDILAIPPRRLEHYCHQWLVPNARRFRLGACRMLCTTCLKSSYEGKRPHEASRLPNIGENSKATCRSVPRVPNETEDP